VDGVGALPGYAERGEFVVCQVVWIGLRIIFKNGAAR